MELVRTIMLNIILLFFFAALLDVLLPATAFRGYIQMAMGFFTVLVILQPITALLERDYTVDAAQYMRQAEQAAMVLQTENNAISQSGSHSITQAEEQYAVQTAKQVNALLTLSGHEVQAVQCMFIDADDCGTTRKMMLDIVSCETEAGAKLIQQAICDYLGLDASQVQVTYLQEEANSHDS